VLVEWLGPDLRAFWIEHLRKQPYAAPGRAAGAIPLFTWSTLDRVLAAPGPIDVLTVQSGRLVEGPPPRSAAAVRSLMAEGVSTVLRASERHDSGLAGLASSFAGVLPGEIHLQLYATPGGTHSYGWHYDFEDVFIAQTDGVKDYYFRDNTVARDMVLGDSLDFSAVLSETSTLMSVRLIAGDWLYIPARWWHFVKYEVDSLSISVGVLSPVELGKARHIPEGWRPATSP
jgi:hypothetical protein